ncbi:MAG TPA: Hsp20/alpha crystallin family protein [Candidatus Paceibacterota bacterium]|nr:Hsp20/alpha crystallin family protein [Candidatus Paceibacterota bacterium]
MKKSSFFSRITGASDDHNDADHFGTIGDARDYDAETGERRTLVSPRVQDWNGGDQEGELAVDVYQTPDAIVVKALIAGVQPVAVDITLAREMITITGAREDEREVEDDGYFQRELYWGSFSRTILLPEEVDVDMAEATEKHGILTIRLPKINKKRQTKLKVRTR